MPIERDVENISPELALIDEQLGSLGRRALPDAPDTLSSLERSPHEQAAVMPSSRRRSRRTATLLGAAVVALVLVGMGARLAASHETDTRTASHASAPKSPLETTSGSVQRDSPLVLRWRSVRGATFYNVIFWRDGVRALDLWPRAASVRIPDGKLDPGVYQWFVYPSFGKDAAGRYGKVAARGTVKI
jgi:hypothetical protein